MKDIFEHLDKIKKIIKENKENSPNQKKTQNKSPFITSIENNNSDINKNNHYYINNNYNKPISITRPSVIDITNNIEKADFTHNYYLIEEGSDSEDCINEETKETIPSLTKVAKNIFDPNKIMILEDIKYFPKEATPGLIITGIEEWVTDKHLKYFLQEVPTFVDVYKRSNNNYYNYNDTYLNIHSIKFFVEQKQRYAYVQLNSFSQMEIIANFFLAPIKKLHPSYNSKKEKIEVYLAYNILELTKNHWYGVILRNLPPNCNDKSLYNFTEQKVENGIKYCLNPILVDNLYCALVVCKELEYAEKLCFDLNNSEINNKLIKAHLHPNICKIRNDGHYNNYNTFSKSGYEYDNIAEESEKCIEHSKTFMEFFFSNYINTVFNSKNKKKEEENKIKTDKNNNNSNDNKKNIKDNKDNKKSKKKNDLILASSIFNLFKKSKIKEPKKKINNNPNSNVDILNNNNPIKDNNNNTNKINNENNMITSKDEKNITNNHLKENTDAIADSNIRNKNNQSKEDINKELLLNSNNLNKNSLTNNENIVKETIDNTNNDKKVINNDIKNDDDTREKGEIIESDPTPMYSERDIKYYTYNMGDLNYYEEKEKNEPRKVYTKYRRNNRDNNYNPHFNNYNNNNFINNYPKYNNYYIQNNYNKNNYIINNYYNTNNYNNFNTNYKIYDFKNYFKPYYSSSFSTNYKNYKNQNYINHTTNDKIRDIDKDRDNETENGREYTNDNNNRKLERSREKSIEEEKIIKNRDKKYNNYNFNYNKWNEKERYPNNKKYNGNKFYDKNNNNKFYDNNKYIEGNDRNERRKDSWHSKSNNNNNKKE